MDTRVAVKEWSLSMRANHWLMALSIFILIPTGFYIADPFSVGAGETTDKFLMGHVRYVHILFGIILSFTLIWRLYIDVLFALSCGLEGFSGLDRLAQLLEADKVLRLYLRGKARTQIPLRAASCLLRTAGSSSCG
jgi:hypothetical protein